MASLWWPLTLSRNGASYSSPADFLHLLKTNAEKISQLTSNEVPLNPHQCKSMSFKLGKTMQRIEYIVELLNDTNLMCSSVALENFYRVFEKAKQLVEKCCSVDWLLECAFQIQNEEGFKEILLEANLSYNTIIKLLKDINCDNIFLYEDYLFQDSTFDPPSADEVFKDRVALQNRLEDLVNLGNIPSASQYLGKYLLGRVDFALHQSKDEDFDVRSFNLWPDGKGPNEEWSKVPENLGDNVSKTTWLGIPCAKKLFTDAMLESVWLAEAKILANLNHPNIVKFLCSNKYENSYIQGYFIAMEQCGTSLRSFIQRLKEGGSRLSVFPALDVILQIAYGMCYIHEHGIAHRDLKTSNVVVRHINAPQLNDYLEVKIVDFGISKGGLNQHMSNTITRPNIGTTLYMPPEAFEHGKANWFKADVYSFSIMCSVILSGEEPFPNLYRKALCNAIRRGDRPKLPVDTPKELTSLIMEGWANDRDSRPNFKDICIRLEELRHHLLRRHSLGSGWKQTDQDNSSEYIREMLQKRSKARELEYSHSRLQRAVNLMDEEEWFDGEEWFDREEMPQQVQHQEVTPQQQVADSAVTLQNKVAELSTDVLDLLRAAEIKPQKSLLKNLKELAQRDIDHQCIVQNVEISPHGSAKWRPARTGAPDHVRPAEHRGFLVGDYELQNNVKIRVTMKSHQSLYFHIVTAPSSEDQPPELIYPMSANSNNELSASSQRKFPVLGETGFRKIWMITKTKTVPRRQIEKHSVYFVFTTEKHHGIGDASLTITDMENILSGGEVIVQALELLVK